MCCFCNEFSGMGPGAPFGGLPNGSRVFWDAGAWAFLPTLGGFVDGYVLAVHRAHRRSLYHCDAADLRELEESLEPLARLYKLAYRRPFLLFEHGTLADQRLSAASVDHAHVHFLPMAGDPWPRLRDRYGLEAHELSGLSALRETADRLGLRSYLLFGSGGRLYLIDDSRGQYPSQFFRRALCRELRGDDAWDWRKHPFPENLYGTYRRFQRACARAGCAAVERKRDREW